MSRILPFSKSLCREPGNTAGRFAALGLWAPAEERARLLLVLRPPLEISTHGSRRVLLWSTVVGIVSRRRYSNDEQDRHASLPLRLDLENRKRLLCVSLMLDCNAREALYEAVQPTCIRDLEHDARRCNNNGFERIFRRTGTQNLPMPRGALPSTVTLLRKQGISQGLHSRETRISQSAGCVYQAVGATTASTETPTRPHDNDTCLDILTSCRQHRC